jgi:hypothetical protein
MKNQMVNIQWTEEEVLFVRYLLGLLPVEEQEAIEEQYFSDPAVLEQVDVVEDQLITAYLDNRLDGEFSREFRRSYGQDMELRKRVDAAIYLRAALRPAQRADSLAGPGPKFVGMFFRKWPTFVATAAAVTFVAILLVQNSDLRKQLSKQPPSGSTAQTSPIAPTIQMVSPPEVLAFTLVPGITKGSKLGPPNRFRIGPAIKEIRISFELLGAKNISHVDIEIGIPLAGGETRTSLIRSNVQAISTTTGETAILVARMSELLPGDYVASVRLPGTSGPNSILETYSFSLID